MILFFSVFTLNIEDTAGHYSTTVKECFPLKCNEILNLNFNLALLKRKEQVNVLQGMWITTMFQIFSVFIWYLRHNLDE